MKLDWPFELRLCSSRARAVVNDGLGDLYRHFINSQVSYSGRRVLQFGEQLFNLRVFL